MGCIILEFKREDYIYFRVVEDYHADQMRYKKGDILRFKRSDLIEKLRGWNFKTYFGWGKAEIVPKQECEEDTYLFPDVYESITVQESFSHSSFFSPGAVICFDEWLSKHFNKGAIKKLLALPKKEIKFSFSDDILYELEDDNSRRSVEVDISFQKGEKLDFNNSNVAVLFYDLKLLKLLETMELIKGEEKQRLFDEDFSNAIYAKDNLIDSVAGLNEYHYFKIKDGIKVKSMDELKSFPWYTNDFIKDTDGYIQYLFTKSITYSTPSREVEQAILIFADRVSKEEAARIHQCYLERKQEENNKRNEEINRRYLERLNQLQTLYEEQKYSDLFPGIGGHFHGAPEGDYSLTEIKNFYKRLSELNSDIVKEMIFYGGTVPYVLNNASESRNFGDVDIFIPIEYIDQLREELSKHSDFKMISDSKSITEKANFTSIINNSDENGEEKTDTDNPEEILASIEKTLEKICNPEKFIKKVIQDFGFKANLFGINISVFPIYQYDNSIMGKSFNTNGEYPFLLAINLINDTSIDHFTKSVKVFDSEFKIMPLEYTLASKGSAIIDKANARLDKDIADINYILSHKEELGISDQLFEELVKKYPDYSIEIAYQIKDGNKIMMNGSQYKKYVLTRVIS